MVNKWDAVPEKDNSTAGEFVKDLRRRLKFLQYAPVQFISAKTGDRVGKIFQRHFEEGGTLEDFNVEQSKEDFETELKAGLKLSKVKKKKTKHKGTSIISASVTARSLFIRDGYRCFTKRSR